MTPAVEILSVSVRAGSAVILDRVSVEVQAGMRVAVVGPNGAGKTSLLRTIAGEQRPHAGRLRLKGRDVASYGAAALALHRAVLSQHVTVAFPFTVAEIVRMGAGPRRGHAVDALVEAALEEVDLSAFHDRIMTTLSGGEQHRAHFARVLVQLACGEKEHGPGLLLLDEPTASLDLRHQIAFAEVTRRRASQGTAVIAVLHDLNLATTFADRILVLDRGRIAADGSPDVTITPSMLEEVFGVRPAQEPFAVPPTPFVLPQLMTPAAPRDRHLRA